MTSKGKLLGTTSVAALVLLLFAGVVAIATAQEVSSQTSEKRIALTAIDKDLHSVMTLTPEDLRLVEDGKPQRITGFRRSTDQAVTLAILIDASGSQEKTLPGERLAATSFVDLFIKRGRDKAAIASLTGTLKVEQPPTDDVALLHQAIARVNFVPPPGYAGGGIVVLSAPPASSADWIAGSTAIWDGIVNACDKLLPRTASPTRLAIILLTDGEDTSSKTKMSAAVDRAIRDNVAVYSIGIADSKLYGLNKDALRKISERTGGRAFFPKHGEDFQAIFAEIGEDLRTQYTITYSSTASAGSARRIKVEIVNPALRNLDIQLSYQEVTARK